MNLLLLLSALLSALGSVGQVVRGTRAPQAVCASLAASPVTTAPRGGVAERPVQMLPIAARAVVSALVALRLPPAEPIFAARRRE